MEKLCNFINKFNILNYKKSVFRKNKFQLLKHWGSFLIQYTINGTSIGLSLKTAKAFDTVVDGIILLELYKL